MKRTETKTASLPGTKRARATPRGPGRPLSKAAHPRLQPRRRILNGSSLPTVGAVLRSRARLPATATRRAPAARPAAAASWVGIVVSQRRPASRVTAEARWR